MIRTSLCRSHTLVETTMYTHSFSDGKHDNIISFTISITIVFSLGMFTSD